MDDMNTTRPKLAKGVAEQWVKGTSELPQQQPPEKTELEKKKGRLEWLEMLLCLFSILLCVYLLYMNIAYTISATGIRLIALFHPLVIFLLYHLRILEPASKTGNQGIALMLFLSSICALLTAVRAVHIQFIDFLAFVFPVLMSAFIILVCNRIHKKRGKRYLSFLISIVWLPFYSIAFVMLSSISLPALHTTSETATISRIMYDGEGGHSVLLHIPVSDTLIECSITKQESKDLQSGDTVQIDEKISWLGIRYFEIDPDM